MAGLPQLVALFGAGGGSKIHTAHILGNRRKHLGLLAHAHVRAMEFQQQQGHFGQFQPRISVGRTHVQLIHQFDPGHGYPVLDRGHHRLTGRINRRERHARCRYCLRYALQLQRHLGDQPQGPFRSHQQLGHIVPGAGLFGPLRCADDATVCHDCLKRDDVVLHRAIAHRIGARGPGRGHATQRRIRPRINGKKQSPIPQMCVQLLPRDARLDNAIQILGIDCKDFIHLAQVN
mmetsp:Transcript_22831/g.38033  ORF Transcript_22831/g.38033 Transcript_22831/m.38033 type:complete len:233 (-) Transcript_22831:3213-3911(-)